MVKVLRFVASFGVAFAAGLVGVVPVATLGLSVPFYVVGPLALGAGGLLAAVGASWVSNVGVGDRGRLLAVVGVVEVAALVLAALLFAGPLVGIEGLLFGGPLIYTLAVFVGVIALNASLAALLLREPRGRLAWDGTLTLLLSAAWLALVLLAGPLPLSMLVPALPEAEFFTSFGGLMWSSVILLAVGVGVAVWRSRRYSPGHQLGRDAAVTLCLLAAIPLVVAGTTSALCSTLLRCVA